MSLRLDMKTGKQLWKQKFADYKEGYTGIIAPLIANGEVVITGMAGGDRTTRGFLDGCGPGNWPEAMAPLYHSGAGRTWFRDVAQGYPGRLEVRRGLDLAEWLL